MNILKSFEPPFQMLEAFAVDMMAEIHAFRAAKRCLAAVKTKLPLAQASEHFSKPRLEILEVGGIHVNVVQERLDAERLDILEDDLRHYLLKV